MTRQRVRLIGSGRTDAGVHALGQVANFQTSASIPLEGFRRGLNSLLPPDIVIKSVEEAAPDFNAQLLAKRKTYLYVILNREVPLGDAPQLFLALPRLPRCGRPCRKPRSFWWGRRISPLFRPWTRTRTIRFGRFSGRTGSTEKAPFLCFAIEARGFLETDGAQHRRDPGRRGEGKDFHGGISRGSSRRKTVGRPK